MKAGDLQKYAELLGKIFVLEQQLQHNRPTNVAEYQALIAQLASLYDEARLLISGNDVTPADIDAAHAQNQAQWGDTKPPQG